MLEVQLKLVRFVLVVNSELRQNFNQIFNEIVDEIVVEIELFIEEVVENLNIFELIYG